MSIEANDVSLHDGAKILLIDKDGPETHSMMNMINISGMHAAVAHNHDAVYDLTTRFKPNIVLMDIGLRQVNGYGLLKLFADRRDCGLIVVSEQDEESDRIVSLELGADDYILKATNSREVMARIRALHRRMRRSEAFEALARSQDEVLIGSIRINLPARTVKTLDGKLIPMTGAEFGLIAVLAEARGQAVSRDTLSETVLRRPWQPEDRSIDQLVFSIRRKLPLDHTGSRLIHSIRALGYVMRVADKDGSEIQD